jgi:two-component system nitrate/nitrite response regulator NarL
LASSHFAVSGEASSIKAAIQAMASGQRPDLVLLDFDTADEEEMDCIRRLHDGDGTVRIVVLTNEMSSQRLAQSLAAGVDGYLLKDMSPNALAQSLRLVLLGEKVFPTNLAPMLISGNFDPAPAIQQVVQPRGLSEREVQILTCLVNGFSNKSIANRLEVTEGTVKVHLKSLLRKLNVSNRTQAAIWALNSGIGGAGKQATADPRRAPAPAASTERVVGRLASQIVRE